ncbi:MAG: CoA-binding protein [Bacteroidetes bacterium]|nr:CoA-binding protein [Bacteroidota bacterium]MBU1116668.1 CoA-binding protein [Bacteroidota bacterium]MBU1798752.1 CoA-binding protein [Bacteroidota bacterium]
MSKKNLAVVGVSRNKNKFGTVIYNELKKKGYNVFAVNPSTTEIGGDKCYQSIKELKDEIEAVVIVVPGIQTEIIVEEANEIGIKHIWMQQGSESDKAIIYCKKNGIEVIHNECILMFANPVKSIHSVHKWIWKILGKLPK